MQHTKVILAMMFFSFALLFAIFMNARADAKTGESKIPGSKWLPGDGFVVHEWGVRVFLRNGLKPEKIQHPKHFKSIAPVLKIAEIYPDLTIETIQNQNVPKEKIPNEKVPPVKKKPDPIPEPIPIPEIPANTHKPVIYFYNNGKLKFDCSIEFADSVPDVWFPDAKLENRDNIAVAELDSWLRGYETFYNCELADMMNNPNRVGQTIPRGTQLLYHSLKWKQQEVKKNMANCKEYRNPSLNWKGVDLKEGKARLNRVPDKHWAARARDVEAMTVEIKGQEEKYIFYEGKGWTTPDLQTEVFGDRMLLYNTGKHKVFRVMVVAVGKKKSFCKTIGDIEGETNEGFGTATLRIKPEALEKNFSDACNDSFVSASIESGLYEDEAVSMADIWREDFFNKPGLRVLYIWDGAKYDEVYPMKLSVEPKSVKRVMVAQLELEVPAALKLD